MLLCKIAKFQFGNFEIFDFCDLGLGFQQRLANRSGTTGRRAVRLAALRRGMFCASDGVDQVRISPSVGELGALEVWNSISGTTG